MKGSIFDSIGKARVSKNMFDLSHSVKMSGNMGFLYPVLCEEVVPGDSFRGHSSVLCRYAPMLAPTMHLNWVRIEYHFVPMRLLWEDSEDFFTGGRLGTTSPIKPYINAPHQAVADGLDVEYFAQRSLWDSFGLQIVTNPGAYAGERDEKIDILPFRAYQRIWSDYYREQNVTPEVDFSKASGDFTADTAELELIMQFRKRAWQKDRYTTAAPTAQRGAASGAPVQVTYKAQSDVKLSDGTDMPDQTYLGIPLGQAAGKLDGINYPAGTTAGNARIENISALTLMIEDFRKANSLQKFLEALGRSGGRYVEYLKGIWGVRSSDARLQRSEFLGSGKLPVNVSEVLSTFEFDGGDIPQGNMAGHGYSQGVPAGFSRRFEEHGYLVAFLSVVPECDYSSQGIDPMWQRFDRLDHFTPQFEGLGEEAISQKELFVDLDAVVPLPIPTFGYNSRYSSYKWRHGKVTGDMRTNFAHWHENRMFSYGGDPLEPEFPTLSEEFIYMNPTERIFAVTDPLIHHLYIMVRHNIKALRPMSYYGIPGNG